MRQKFGQNFLVNSGAAEAIVDAANLTPVDNVLEIGPGKGVLTNLILQKVKNLTAVEVDPVLSEKLKTKYAEKSNFSIINKDFLDFDLNSLNEPYKIIANLPYYISTAIIDKIFSSNSWSAAVLMVQKEVAERIVSEKDKSSYGYFSIICQYYSKPKIILKCPPDYFSPKPLVDSVVLHFENLNSAPLSKEFLETVKIAFSHKRKKIINSFLLSTKLEKEVLLKAFENAGINPSLRPENLSIKDYQNLTNSLNK